MSDTLSELLAEALAFRDARDWSQFHTPRHLAAAISIEASELQEAMLWKSDGDIETSTQDPAKAAGLRHELADVMIYCLLLSHRLGVDPASAIREKLALNEAKYPVLKARGKADKYTAYEE